MVLKMYYIVHSFCFFRSNSSSNNVDWCFISVSPVSHKCFTSVYLAFHQCFIRIAKVYHQFFYKMFHNLQKTLTTSRPLAPVVRLVIFIFQTKLYTPTLPPISPPHKGKPYCFVPNVWQYNSYSSFYS